MTSYFGFNLDRLIDIFFNQILILVNPSTTVSTLRPVVRSHGDPYLNNKNIEEVLPNLAKTYQSFTLKSREDKSPKQNLNNEKPLPQINLRVAHHGSAKQTTKLPYIVKPTPPKPFIKSTSPATYLVNPSTTVSTLRPVVQRNPSESYPLPPIPTYDPNSVAIPPNPIKTYTTSRPIRQARIKPPTSYITDPPFFSESLSQIPHPNIDPEENSNSNNIQNHHHPHVHVHQGQNQNEQHWHTDPYDPHPHPHQHPHPKLNPSSSLKTNSNLHPNLIRAKKSTTKPNLEENAYENINKIKSLVDEGLHINKPNPRNFRVQYKTTINPTTRSAKRLPTRGPTTSRDQKPTPTPSSSPYLSYNGLPTRGPTTPRIQKSNPTPSPTPYLPYNGSPTRGPTKPPVQITTPRNQRPNPTPSPTPYLSYNGLPTRGPTRPPVQISSSSPLSPFQDFWNQNSRGSGPSPTVTPKTIIPYSPPRPTRIEPEYTKNNKRHIPPNSGKTIPLAKIKNRPKQLEKPYSLDLPHLDSMDGTRKLRHTHAGTNRIPEQHINKKPHIHPHPHTRGVNVETWSDPAEDRNDRVLNGNLDSLDEAELIELAQNMEFEKLK